MRTHALTHRKYMSDLLKKVIQGLINEDESSASEALHQYITNKTRQIA